MSLKSLPKQQEVVLKQMQQAKDIRFGNVVMFTDPHTGAIYTRKDKVFETKDQLKSVASSIKQRINSPNLFYVAPLTFEFDSTTISTQPNQQAPVLKLYTPYPHETLDLELQMRLERQNPLNNKEITYLMYDLLYGLYHLQGLGFNHGKFGPEFVAKTTTGYAILDDPMYYQYDVIDLKKRKYWYLCPLAYKSAIQQQRAGKGYDLIKSDVFALGLVMLEAAIQMDIDDIYGQTESRSLDSVALAQMINVMEGRYRENNLLTSTIKKMLSFDEKDRPDFQEMVKRMPDYQMIKNYFEQVEMSPEDFKSMRNSMHGSVVLTKGAKEFGKMTPSGSKKLRQSMRNSRYYQQDEEEDLGKLDFFKKDLGHMIKSEVVEKHVVHLQVSDLGTESESMGLQPQIMVKTQKIKKPPTPKKQDREQMLKENDDSKQVEVQNSKDHDAIAALQKQVEFLTQALMMQNQIKFDN